MFRVFVKTMDVHNLTDPRNRRFIVFFPHLEGNCFFANGAWLAIKGYKVTFGHFPRTFRHFLLF